MDLVGYPVGIEVHHQLHCLVRYILRLWCEVYLIDHTQNIIRKNLYYYVSSTQTQIRSTNAEEFHILHVGK
jgi:hypothetical protein